MFLRRARPFLILLAWLATCILVIVYIKTAYQSSRFFQFVCLVEFVIAFAAGISSHRWRFVLVGFAILSFPRIPSILGQAALHNVLFPLFLGLAFGRLLIGFRFLAARSNDEPTPSYSGYFTLFVILLLLSASASSVLQYSEFEISFANRILAPGMTTHYAMFLSTTLALNLLAPLLWIAAERAVAASHDRSSPVRDVTEVATAANPNEVARYVAMGVTLGVIAYAAVALLQGSIASLSAGIADRGIEMGRRPGLFSDSGSSGAILCSLIMMAAIFIFPKRRVASFSLFLLMFCITMPFQGRVIWLGLAGVCMVLPFCYNQLHLSPRPLMVAVLFCATLLIVVLCFGKYSILDTDLVFQAMQRIDPVRPTLLDWGLEIFWKSPWVGHGLNSFIPQLMESEVIHPEIFPENSPGLIPGILNDVGILGFLVLAVLLGRYLRLLAQTMSTSAFADIQLRAFVFLPLSLAPTFLIGYHVLHPEIAAFVLLPLLVVPPGR
ncbi:MAG: hypothetical protein K8S54_08460 [Spirochaetia bacterium]|nr:hypothetical protein [Spirochaetia bacterium]